MQKQITLNFSIKAKKKILVKKAGYYCFSLPGLFYFLYIFFSYSNSIQCIVKMFYTFCLISKYFTGIICDSNTDLGS